MKNTCFLLFIILISRIGYSQIESIESGILFSDETVPRVDITISQADLDQILDPENSSLNIEYPATFIFTHSGEVDTVQNVGFRLRGNTSRQSAKPSFKVSFNTFEPGRKYHNIEKLNLNGEHNDPTIARSKISWQIMSDQGLLASRSNHIQLYINNEYRGLYLNVEHIDEEFLKLRFEDWSGNLFKCLWPADLTYRGEHSVDYQFEHNGRRAYDLKTNTDANDYSDLAQLIDVINNTPTQDLPCALEPIFDIQSYLKLVAVDVFIGNWDGNFFNKNNFYLYHDPCSDQFIMIPYDLDNTFGIDWFSIDWSTASLDDWLDNHQGSRPLTDRLMSIQKYRNNVDSYLKELMTLWENQDYQNEFTTLRDFLLPYRKSDNYAALDYGYTVNDFKNNYIHGLSGHVKHGLVEYVSRRISSLSDQLNSNDVSVPAVEDYSIYRTEDSITLTFKLKFIDQDNTVEIQSNFDNNSFSTSIILPNDDDNYQITFPIEDMTTQYLSWHLTLSYGIAGAMRYPTCGNIDTRVNARPLPTIVINEVVSSNTSGVKDEEGEYPDWIELYNYGTEAIELGDLYLTDRIDNLTLWQLPDSLLMPESYLIIYADSDGQQGPLHTNFKLNKDGEYLALVESKTNFNGIIDSLTLPALESNQSYGRLPNGFGGFVELPFQSPQRNNEVLSEVTPQLNNHEFSLFPNPVKQKVRVQSTHKGVLTLYSSNGVCLITETIEQNDQILDLSQLKSGIYLVYFSTPQGLRHTQMIFKH